MEAFNNGLAGGAPEYSGVKLTNTAGSGGVTIKSSAAANYFDFSDNYYYGIAIYSKGVVSVSNVTVNNTISKIGLLIENQTSSSSPAVTITNSEFNLNNWSGVTVKSKGTITLTNVTSTNSQNSYSGVILDNIYGTSSGVTIRSSLASTYYEFSKNTGTGIEIYSKGAVSVSNVIAEGNIAGIYIRNQIADSDMPVSITNSMFNLNNQSGIDIGTRGAVSLTNTGAKDNINGYGVTITNWYGLGAYRGGHPLNLSNRIL